MAFSMRRRVCSLCIKYCGFGRLRNISQPHKFSRSVADYAVNHDYSLDPEVQKLLDGGLSHKKHPGIVRQRKVELPDRLQKAISIVLENHPVDKTTEKTRELYNYLWSRKPPLEHDHLKQLSRAEFQNLRLKDGRSLEGLTPEEAKEQEAAWRNKTLKKLRKHVYHWKPITFNHEISLLYLMTRMAPEYAVLKQIFSEIAMRDPTLKPRTIFDYGSGLASTVWAANTVWPDSLYEHYLVDESTDMSDLARLLLQGGRENGTIRHKGVYFRPFMSSADVNPFHMVVSAFSLMELPSYEDRLAVLTTLWDKTEKYLIIAENGTNAGFQLIMEARDHILQMAPADSETAVFNSHVVAPCPHDVACPRMMRQDNTPCNFEVTYKPLADTQKADKMNFHYCYVVLKKEPRTNNLEWSRIVRIPKNPSRMYSCHTCTPQGDLEHSVITNRRHGRDFYWCARYCRWGDRFPGIQKVQQTETDTSDENDQKLSISTTTIGSYGVGQD